MEDGVFGFFVFLRVVLITKDAYIRLHKHYKWLFQQVLIETDFFH